MKILAVDDHPVFLKGLILLLKSMFEDAQIDEETSGKKAVKKILDNDYDLIILDFRLNDITGLQVLNEVKPVKSCKFIMLTMYDDEEIADEVIKAGVNGYILKENTASEIQSAVEAVFEGKQYIDKRFSKKFKTNNEDTIRKLKNLTAQEVKILKYISKKYSSKEISDMLDISVKTVENHRTNISAKLNLSGSNSLMSFAIENKAIINILIN